MISLKNANIKLLHNNDWLAYFRYNNQHLLKLDFSKNNELNKKEIELISPSIKAFQIGEGSKGIHLRKAVFDFSNKTNDLVYPEIMELFIKEETRHSQTLKKFMDIYQIPTNTYHVLDYIFCCLRKIFRLQGKIVVLVTAEIIALSYYSALSNATHSKLLKKICKQMLNDELMHVIFQSYTLFRISKTQKELQNKTIIFFRKILMDITLTIVWANYKKLFLKGNYPYNKFRKACFIYLQESIQIQKTGDFLNKVNL